MKNDDGGPNLYFWIGLGLFICLLRILGLDDSSRFSVIGR